MNLKGKHSPFRIYIALYTYVHIHTYIAACKRKRVVYFTHVNSTIMKEKFLPNNFTLFISYRILLISSIDSNSKLDIISVF